MKRFIWRLIGALVLLILIFLVPLRSIAQSFGDQSFTEYEAFLHPAQEPDPSLKSQAKAYGRLQFPRNLSAGKINVQLSGIEASNVTAFHIHCGAPGVLGPIIVDLAQFGDLPRLLQNGQLSGTVVNQGLTFIKQAPMPPKPGSGKLTLPLPEGCPSDLNFPVQQVNTIAGLEALARKGALYFNLHTKGHEFYGELRGQIYPAASTQNIRAISQGYQDISGSDRRVGAF